MCKIFATYNVTAIEIQMCYIERVLWMRHQFINSFLGLVSYNEVLHCRVAEKRLLCWESPDTLRSVQNKDLSQQFVKISDFQNEERKAFLESATAFCCLDYHIQSAANVLGRSTRRLIKGVWQLLDCLAWICFLPLLPLAFCWLMLLIFWSIGAREIKTTGFKLRKPSLDKHSKCCWS